MEVSIIGGGIQSTQRKPQTCCKSLSHNVVSSTPCHEWDSNSLLVVIDNDCTSSCKSNCHMITAMTATKINKPLKHNFISFYIFSLSSIDNLLFLSNTSLLQK